MCSQTEAVQSVGSVVEPTPMQVTPSTPSTDTPRKMSAQTEIAQSVGSVVKTKPIESIPSTASADFPRKLSPQTETAQSVGSVVETKPIQSAHYTTNTDVSQEKSLDLKTTVIGLAIACCKAVTSQLPPSVEKKLHAVINEPKETLQSWYQQGLQQIQQTRVEDVTSVASWIKNKIEMLISRLPIRETFDFLKIHTNSFVQNKALPMTKQTLKSAKKMAFKQLDQYCEKRKTANRSQTK